MITDEERREAARRLREYVDIPDDWWADTYSGFYVEKCVFGDVERHRESELFARLADLIEPGEPKTTCVAEVKIEGDKLDEAVHRAMAEYAGVDRDALLALAEEIERKADEALDESAHSISEAVATSKLNEYTVRNGIARRIREALGVSDG